MQEGQSSKNTIGRFDGNLGIFKTEKNRSIGWRAMVIASIDAGHWPRARVAHEASALHCHDLKRSRSIVQPKATTFPNRCQTAARGNQGAQPPPEQARGQMGDAENGGHQSNSGRFASARAASAAALRLMLPVAGSDRGQDSEMLAIRARKHIHNSPPRKATSRVWAELRFLGRAAFPGRLIQFHREWSTHP